MLTRKYYPKFADIIKNIADKSTRTQVAREFAGILRDDNPNFKHSVWFRACDVDY